VIYRFLLVSFMYINYCLFYILAKMCGFCGSVSFNVFDAQDAILGLALYAVYFAFACLDQGVKPAGRKVLLRPAAIFVTYIYIYTIKITQQFRENR
jgi:hypothetical protein